MKSRYFTSASTTGSRRFAALLTLLFIFALLCGGVFWALEQFRVKNIECTEAGEPCDANVLTFFAGYKGKRIFQPFVFDVPLKKGVITPKYPSTLVVRIDTPKLMYHLFIDDKKSVAVYSDGSYQESQGSFDPTAERLRITDATLATSSGTGKIPDERMHSYLSLIEKQRELELESVVFHSDDEIEIQTKRQLTGVLSLQNFDAELRSLQVILYSPTIEQKPARVDLRFERPVLRYL